MEEIEINSTNDNVYIKVVKRNLKIDSTIKISKANKIETVTKDLINAFKKVKLKYTIMKQIKVLESERIKLDSLEKELSELDLRKEEISKNRLNLVGIINLSNSSKLGSIKTTTLNNLKSNLNVIDLKIKNAFSKAKIEGLIVADRGLSKINNIKNEVSSFKSEQIEKYKDWRLGQLRKQERAQAIMKKVIEEQERIRKEQAKILEVENKRVLQQIEQRKLQRREKNNERILNFKKGTRAKVSLMGSKLGSVKTSFLKSTNNLDLKLSNAFSEAQINILSKTNKGVENLNNAKNNFLIFKSEQIEKYRQYKISKALEIEEKNKIKLEEENRKKALEERKKAMKEALREQDRENELKKQEYLKLKKEKIIEDLKQQKDQLMKDNNTVLDSINHLR